MLSEVFLPVAYISYLPWEWTEVELKAQPSIALSKVLLKEETSILKSRGKQIYTSL